MTTFYCLIFESPPTWKTGSRIYIPQGQGGPLMPPGNGFPFLASYDSQGYGGVLERYQSTSVGSHAVLRSALYVT
jgi:hypothetical protein